MFLRYYTGDDVAEIEGRPDGRMTPLLHDCSDDSLCSALFAIFTKGSDQFAFIPTVDDLFGSQERANVKPHIERPIVSISESPLRRVELKRGKSQI